MMAAVQCPRRAREADFGHGLLGCGLIHPTLFAAPGAPEAQKAAQQASAGNRTQSQVGSKKTEIPVGNAGSPGDHAVMNASRSGQRGARTPDPLGVNEVL